MSLSSCFKEQWLYFRFAINGIRSADWEAGGPDDRREQAWRFTQLARERLTEALPELPEWTIPDEEFPEIRCPIFEVCEDEFDPSTSGELAAFYSLIYCHRPVDLPVARLLQCAVQKCYEDVARETGGECQYLYTESVVARTVTKREMLEL